MISSVIGSPRVRVDLATQPYRGFADDHREAARPLQRNGKRAVGRLRYPGATPPLGTRPVRSARGNVRAQKWTASHTASIWPIINDQTSCRRRNVGAFNVRMDQSALTCFGSLQMA